MEVTKLSTSISFLMNSISFESLLVTVFVLVDDWYQSQKKSAKRQTPGETQFVNFIRANYGEWFPHLLERSQFNRRLRKLGSKIETLRREWVKQLGAETANSFVVDTKPIPVVGYRRSKKRSDFDGSAGANANAF